MINSNPKHRGDPLLGQLRWFIQLRWIAAVCVVGGALIARHFNWYPDHADRIITVGCLIALYNATLRWLPIMRRPERLLRTEALVQIVLDLACLTALTMWTGGVRSPLVSFFVFHMVFASLLLPQVRAYFACITAMIFIAAGLALTDQLPQTFDLRMALCGELLTLILTVTLTNRITRDLRRQRRRLIRQNRRIKAMSEQLRRQQQAMVQHEKMVAMGQMAAGVTHEITNPLASKHSPLQLAERRPDRMNRPETVQTLREQIARISQIIQQMKTFAHPTDQQQQTLPLNEVVEKSLEMVRFDKRLRGVSVKQEFDPNAGVVPMLPQALEQVLVNLIINALDAMAGVSEPTLTLKTHRREGWCTVEVRDNGHGIDPSHMDRLFEPFFTTKPLGKGTGLGLSISYSLMQKQGGSISVRSQLGKGATFILRLPTTDEASRTRESGATRIAASENPPQ
jgi:C4-dicarboxylate-specific signal transduction histidine kinase